MDSDTLAAMRRLIPVLLLTMGCGSGTTAVDATGDDDDDGTENSNPSTAVPIDCPDDSPNIDYAGSGLPELQSNPGAPLALFLDFDGGTYHSHSSDDYTQYSGYNRNGSSDDFDAEEQADIIASWTHVSHYFAMFDVNVTTIDEVREESVGWGWILITEEESGGRGSLGDSAIGTEPHARSYAGSSTARIEDGDKSRRLAHELGHNFQLEHSGVWEGNDFYKWEDWDDWDEVYGPIMGGGGYGERNGWSYGNHEGDRDTMQDTMEIIRQRVIDVAGSETGWRIDDFSDSDPTAMCDGDDHAYRRGILGSPDDEDLFKFYWAGGDLRVKATAPDVSAALLEVDVLQDGDVVGSLGKNEGLPAGDYQFLVRSTGEYAAIGSYEITAR